MSDNILQIENLSIEYHSNQETMHAVNGISLMLERGKTIGIVGETGAGKTTTALSILRLLPERTSKITSGRILFNGEDLLEMSEKRMQTIRGEKISIIFQDPMNALNPVMTIGDQILEALALHNEGHSNEELRHMVDETMEMVGIQSARKKEYPHQFSGGMKQRVVIAMALACRPQLLIADEPTTALDVTIQAQVLALMENLKKSLGTSMIMITHDFGIVAQTCDVVATMYAGEIIEYGMLEDYFADGAAHHPYTKSLFEAIPRLDSDYNARLKPIDGLMPDPTDLPSGCKFSPRCPHCTARCTSESPAKYWNGSHMIACNLMEGSDEVWEVR